MKIPPSFRRAFSVLEALVGVMLLALVLALLFPVYNVVRERAKAMKCTSHLKTWSSLISVYIAENNNYFPATSPWDDTKRWFHSEAPLVKLIYPSMSKEQTKAWSMGKDINGCPAHLNEEVKSGLSYRYYSYMMNSELSKRHTSYVKEPARVAILADASSDSTYSTFYQVGYNNRLGRKHSDRAHVLFVDGHLEAVQQLEKDQVLPTQ